MAGASPTSTAFPIALATIALFAVSPLLAPGSLTVSSLASMLPFAAILAVAAVGQTMVVQQGGLDFSVSGTIVLSAVLFTRLADQQSGIRLLAAMLAAVGAAASVGLLNGLLVTKRAITPLIATLAVNALVLGFVQEITGGLSVVPAPEALTRFALGTTLGLYNTVFLALVVLLAYAIAVKSTVFGRRFEAVGAAAAAARIAGVSIGRYRVSAYVTASVTYAISGIMLAGFLRTPGLDVGEPYLLSTIAAVVLGGTALTGGTGSALSTAVAAVFLTQLNALLLASGAPTALNYLFQGVAIAGSIGLRGLVARGSIVRRTSAAALRLPQAPIGVASARRNGTQDRP